MSRPIRLGISPCPNDTFAFHALLHGLVDRRGLTYTVDLCDVQELNEGLDTGRFDVAKASFHAALRVAQDWVVLRSGSALGFGVGPLLLAGPTPAPPGTLPRVLCPGRWTTASLLFDLFHGGTGTVEHCVFSEIMPALEAGRAQWGVCIHEGRFTFAGRGLRCLEDLGERWERDVGGPLPLGGILASRGLPVEVMNRVQATIRDSLAYARAHPAASRPFLAQHAQELEPDVLAAHVDLYVNDWTLDLGDEGCAALAALEDRARSRGIVPGDSAPLATLDRRGRVRPVAGTESL